MGGIEINPTESDSTGRPPTAQADACPAVVDLTHDQQSSPTGTDSEPPSRGRFWTILGAIGVAVVTAIASVGIPCLWDWLFGPKPGVLTDLMRAEVRAAQESDPMDRQQVISSIYSKDAVVVDAGCHTPSAATVWAGKQKIVKRYEDLPDFLSLQHINPRFEWDIANRWSSSAWATSETIGVIASANANPKTKDQFIVGHEQWVFERSGSTWLIKSFTYNLCLQ